MRVALLPLPPLLALLVVVAAGCSIGAPRSGSDAGGGHPSGGTASSSPPGGLAPAEVPLFVQFGFDDNGISGRDGSGTVGGVRFVTDLFDGRTNPSGVGDPRTFDGAPTRFSFYAATRYLEVSQADRPEHVKLEWRRVFEAGHEIGLHTHRHPHGTGFSAAEWSREISDCRSWLTRPFAAGGAAPTEHGLGVPPDQILGFRAPFLEYGHALFPALRAERVTYDCSVEEGFGPGEDGTNFVWPYRVAPGFGAPPRDAQTADGAEGGGRELWELPVYALVVPPDAECARYGVPPGLRARLAGVRDYFDPADGKITGFDWNLWVDFGMSADEVAATFAHTLDLRLAGNRAPLTFGTHSDIYADQYGAATGSTAAERRRALAEILELALARSEVRVVSARQLLDWLRAPVPLGG